MPIVFPRQLAGYMPEYLIFLVIENETRRGRHTRSPTDHNSIGTCYLFF